MDKTCRKAFQQLQKAISEWNACADAVTPVLVKTNEFLRRTQHLLSDDKTIVGVLAAFPGVTESLYRKHLEQLEVLQRTLQGHERTLSTTLTKINEIVDEAFAAYAQQATSLDIEEVASRPATGPAVADYLQWLETLQRMYAEEYERARRVLAKCEAIIKGKSEEKQLSIKEWEQTSVNAARVKEIFALAAGKLPAQVSASLELDQETHEEETKRQEKKSRGSKANKRS